jgi:hypothetical protein
MDQYDQDPDSYLYENITDQFLNIIDPTGNKNITDPYKNIKDPYQNSRIPIKTFQIRIKTSWIRNTGHRKVFVSVLVACLRTGFLEIDSSL